MTSTFATKVRQQREEAARERTVMLGEGPGAQEQVAALFPMLRNRSIAMVSPRHFHPGSCVRSLLGEDVDDDSDDENDDDDDPTDRDEYIKRNEPPPWEVSAVPVEMVPVPSETGALSFQPQMITTRYAVGVPFVVLELAHNEQMNETCIVGGMPANVDMRVLLAASLLRINLDVLNRPMYIDDVQVATAGLHILLVAALGMQESFEMRSKNSYLLTPIRRKRLAEVALMSAQEIDARLLKQLDAYEALGGISDLDDAPAPASGTELTDDDLAAMMDVVDGVSSGQQPEKHSPSANWAATCRDDIEAKLMEVRVNRAKKILAQARVLCFHLFFDDYWAVLSAYGPRFVPTLWTMDYRDIVHLARMTRLQPHHLAFRTLVTAELRNLPHALDHGFDRRPTWSRSATDAYQERSGDAKYALSTAPCIPEVTPERFFELLLKHRPKTQEDHDVVCMAVVLYHEVLLSALVGRGLLALTSADIFNYKDFSWEDPDYSKLCLSFLRRRSDDSLVDEALQWLEEKSVVFPVEVEQNSTAAAYQISLVHRTEGHLVRLLRQIETRHRAWIDSPILLEDGSALQDTERELSTRYEYNELQERAHRLMGRVPIVSLRGAAGTGKSEVLAGFVYEARRAGLKCRVATPTGRAAASLTAKIEEYFESMGHGQRAGCDSVDKFDWGDVAMGERKFIAEELDIGNGRARTAMYYIFFVHKTRQRIARLRASGDIPCSEEMDDGGDEPATLLERLQRELDDIAATQILCVDEIGMLGTQQLVQLLDVFPKLCTLIAVGDPNQLPPIEWGQPARCLDRYCLDKYTSAVCLEVNNRASGAQNLVRALRSLNERGYEEFKKLTQVVPLEGPVPETELQLEYIKMPSCKIMGRPRVDYDVGVPLMLARLFVDMDRPFHDFMAIARRNECVRSFNKAAIGWVYSRSNRKIIAPWLYGPPDQSPIVQRLAPSLLEGADPTHWYQRIVDSAHHAMDLVAQGHSHPLSTLTVGMRLRVNSNIPLQLLAGFPNSTGGLSTGMIVDIVAVVEIPATYARKMKDNAIRGSTEMPNVGSKRSAPVPALGGAVRPIPARSDSVVFVGTTHEKRKHAVDQSRVVGVAATFAVLVRLCGSDRMYWIVKDKKFYKSTDFSPGFCITVNSAQSAQAHTVLKLVEYDSGVAPIQDRTRFGPNKYIDHHTPLMVSLTRASRKCVMTSITSMDREIYPPVTHRHRSSVHSARRTTLVPKLVSVE